MARNVSTPVDDRFEHVNTLRFRGVRSRIERDDKGEYLEIDIPAIHMPAEVQDALCKTNLRESQREEILIAISELTTLNALMSYNER